MLSLHILYLLCEGLSCFLEVVADYPLCGCFQNIVHWCHHQFLEFQRHLTMFLQIIKKGKMLPSDPPIAIFATFCSLTSFCFICFYVSHISVPKIFPFIFHSSPEKIRYFQNCNARQKIVTSHIISVFCSECGLLLLSYNLFNCSNINSVYFFSDFLPLEILHNWAQQESWI